ncbi:MAG: alginate lyase family protein [Verrucomicrobia bacterium]|nr:alginate lyase family protein [Verrucomicrobiota bacterium]MCH8513335.1 heparinase II/III family protein [Kiritimatiellia bacterium]
MNHELSSPSTPPPSTPIVTSSGNENPHPSETDVAVWSRMIDWQLEGLEAARGLWQHGSTVEALRQVGEKILARLRAEGSSMESGMGSHLSESEKRKLADQAMAGKVTLLQFGPVDIGSPINWNTREHEDGQWTVHLSYMHWIHHLADVFLMTGEELYAARWLEVVEDFLEQRPYGTPALNYCSSRPPVLNHAKTCNNGESYGGSDAWISLSCHWRTDSWLYGLRALSRSHVLTYDRLLRILTSLFDEHLHVMVANPRENTPNQFLAIAASMVRLGVAMPEFKAANVAFAIGYERMLRAIGNVMLPDGSDLEQSVNYNIRFCDAMTEVAEYLRQLAPERAKKFHTAARMRAICILALVTPLGRTVSLAKTGILPMKKRTDGWREPLDLLWIDHVFSGGKSGPTPPFQSLVFPYGGYYTLRSGWARTSDYLFFKASAAGLGHMHEDCLSLHITANGYDLIVDSGNFSYTKLTPLDEAMNAYCFKSESHSTVLVDGHGQGRFAQRKNRLWNHDEAPQMRGCDQPPLPARSFEGKGFAFLEGAYADGYGPEGEIQAVHQRSIVWIRQLGWLVVDRLTSETPRHYTGVWTLAPEFSAEQTTLKSGHVAASQAEGGMTLLPVTKGECTLKMFHGSEEPLLGWFSHVYGGRKPKPDIHVGFSATGRVTTMATLILPERLETVKKMIRLEAPESELAAQIDLGAKGRLTFECGAGGSGEAELEVSWTSASEKVGRFMVRGETLLETIDEKTSPLSPIPGADTLLL